MMRCLPRSSWLALAASLSFLGALPAPAQVAQRSTAQPPNPPVALTRARVDTMHGLAFSDDYYWLRQKSDPAVRQYLEAENAYAGARLEHTRPLQEQLYTDMLGRIRQTDLSVPYRDNGFLYYSRTEEGKQYPIFCRKRGALTAPEEILIDLNTIVPGTGFRGLGAFTVSDDGNLLAYSLDTTGFRQYTLHVKDLRTGQTLPDRVERTISVVWAADNRTIFYTVEDHAKRSYRLYRHPLGSTADSLVYEERDERFGLGVWRTRSDRYIVLDAGSLTTSEVRVLPAAQPAGQWKVISPRVANREYDIEHRGDRFYIRVNDTGRNFRLVSAPVTEPSRWTEMLPHRDSVMISGTDLFANHMVVYTRRNGLPEFTVTDLRNKASHRVAFPEPAYSAFPSNNAEWNTNVLRYSYQSMVTPGSVYDYDMNRRAATLLKQTDVIGYDRARYQTERTHATARDGARIPISIVYRRGLSRDGRAPMLLGAYGSYGSSQNPSFSSTRLSLLDRGFVVAVAHIRGGGEMGKAWHDKGRMMNKMNTFTDYIDAAEHLVRERYTASDRLIAEGGSAGGLLMGAVTNMRPELFHAVVAHVPFVDVIGTMSDSTLPLTVGEFEEWGNPRVKAEFEYMMRYDPYRNLSRRAYPAMLVKTSFNDSQVMYHEPAKYVARMRVMRTDTNPLLFVTNMGAGHGGASGRYDRLREIALDYAFMIDQVGLARVTP